jgi:hypothetical protein
MGHWKRSVTIHKTIEAAITYLVLGYYVGLSPIGLVSPC